MREIAACLGKDLNTRTAESIQSLLVDMGWDNAKSVVKDLTHREHIPSNLYGTILGIWESRKVQQQQAHLWKQKWTADQDCATPGEWTAFWKVMGEILRWHQMGLVSSNPDGITTPLTADEYHKAKCPKSWSPIVDHFLTGYYPAMLADVLEDYLTKYHAHLVEARLKKTVGK